jgi:DNA-binding SARP family transcriptional activator/tetratricopeptide (TPR) repeat protein
MMPAMPRNAPPASPQLRLHGEPLLQLAGGRTVALERRAAALLALAALEPGVTRLRAAALLWPDSDDPRRNLRQQLLRFRRTFGRDLLVGTDTLALAVDLVMQADAPGPLLGTLAFDDCDEFAAWLAAQRRGTQGQRQAAIRGRIAQAEAAGELDAALAAAQELLALDPRDESHHREAMRLHYLAGNTAAGLAAYDALRRMLADEFGSKPSAETQALVDALRSAHSGAVRLAAAPAPARAGSLPITLRRPPRLAGREVELAAVRRAWADGLVVWLEGEAGMGKSRLLTELLGAVGNAAPGMLHGTARPGDAGTPYATLARLLQPLWSLGSTHFDPATRSALLHLAPGLGEPGDASPLPPGAMAAAVSALLDRNAVRSLGLDDLHFADDATLDLVATLAAAQEPGQRQWLLATRPAELSGSGRTLRQSLAELSRIGIVSLVPLSKRGVAELLDSLALTGLSNPALAEALAIHAGGNPLFVLETLRQGLVDGSLARGVLPRPASVATLMAYRLQRLSEPALALARVAAVAGVDFHIELAEAATGLRAVQLASAWQELQDAQILREEAFAHDLVADAVLRGVPQPVARRLHADVAAYLQGPGAGQSTPARLAAHLESAGLWRDAVQALRKAAEGARAAGRHLDQAALLDRAAGLCTTVGDAVARFEVQAERLGALILYDVDAAVEAAKALEDAACNDAQRLEAIKGHANLRGVRHESPEALALVDRALPIARALGDRVAELDLQCTAAFALHVMLEPAQAHARLMSQRDWVQAEATPVMRQHWSTHMALVLGGLGRLRDAIQMHETSAALAEAEGLMPELRLDLSNMALVHSIMGRPDKALEVDRRALRVSDQPQGSMAGIVELQLARHLRDDGQFAEAVDLFERFRRETYDRSAPLWRAAARVWQATLWLWLGQHARVGPLLVEDCHGLRPSLEALRLVTRAQWRMALEQPGWREDLALAGEHFDSDDGNGPAHRLARIRLLAPAEALACARRAADCARRMERNGTLLFARLAEAEAALALGDATTARQSAHEALHWLAEGFRPDELLYPAEAWAMAWRALSGAGDADGAAQALHDGVRWVQAHALPHVPAPFVDSFLHRNPTNRTLLAAAAR